MRAGQAAGHLQLRNLQRGWGINSTLEWRAIVYDSVVERLRLCVELEGWRGGGGGLGLNGALCAGVMQGKGRRWRRCSGRRIGGWGWGRRGVEVVEGPAQGLASTARPSRRAQHTNGSSSSCSGHPLPYRPWPCHRRKRARPWHVVVPAGSVRAALFASMEYHDEFLIGQVRWHGLTGLHGRRVVRGGRGLSLVGAGGQVGAPQVGPPPVPRTSAATSSTVPCYQKTES